MIEVIKHSDLIYDVGMHKGEDTEFYLRKGFRVIAFEALPELVDLCTMRLKSYIEEGRLRIVEGAIIDTSAIEAGQRTVRFYQSDASTCLGTIRPEWVERNVRLDSKAIERTVDAVDFVSIVRTYGVPHYIKIDIEGADMICVQAFAMFAEKPDYISFEANMESYAGIRSEIDALTDMGYDSIQAIEQLNIHSTQSCPYPAREGSYVPYKFNDDSSGLFGAELGGAWKSRRSILRRYKLIRLGHFLLGYYGVMIPWRFKGAALARRIVHHALCRLMNASVPGRYDTHARYSKVVTVGHPGA
jgi:FkbM family methyltransferase